MKNNNDDNNNNNNNRKNRNRIKKIKIISNGLK
jgi:hypothetical protein